MDIPVRVIINAINNASGEFRKLSSDLGNAGVDLKKVALAGAALGAATGLLTKDLIQQAGAMEQNEVAFRTMLGSAEMAGKLLADIRSFAKQTPFNLTELVEGSKRLLAYNTEAKDLIPTLSVLGDITAGVGREKLPQLILAYGQVQAATKLTGAELRQFSEAGVPLLATLADQAGVTAAQMVEMISEGEVGFPKVKEALAAMTAEGGKFHGLMQDQSTKTLGKISNMEDSVQQLKVTLGNALLPTVNRTLDRMIPLVEQFAKWASENPKTIDSVIKVGLAIGTVSSAFLVLGPVLSGIMVTFKALAIIAGALKLGAILGGVLTLLTGPIGIAILAIAGSIAFVAMAWRENWLNIHETARSNIETLTTVFNFFRTVVETVMTAIGSYVQYQIDQFNAFKIAAVNVVNGIVLFFQNLPTMISEAIKALPEIFLQNVTSWWYAIGWFVGNLEQFIFEGIPFIAGVLIEFFTVTVPAAISAFISYAQVAIPAFVESFKAWIINLGLSAWQAIVKFKDDSIATFNTFKEQATNKAIETYNNVLNWIKGMVADITTAINELPGNIVSAMEKVKTAAVDKAREIYNGVKEWFDKIVGFFNDIIGKASDAINKSREAFSLGRDAGKRQMGGPVSAASQYLVGERGPELFIPQTAGTIIPNGALPKGGGGNTIQFIVNTDMIINSPQERRSLAEAMYRDLVTLARSHNMTVQELLGG